MSEQWYYTKNDEKYGPVTAERMKELAASGDFIQVIAYGKRE